MRTIAISINEYEKLKKKANLNIDIVKQPISSFKDIKEGRVRRVR